MKRLRKSLAKIGIELPHGYEKAILRESPEIIPPESMETLMLYLWNGYNQKLQDTLVRLSIKSADLQFKCYGDFVLAMLDEYEKMRRERKSKERRW